MRQVGAGHETERAGGVSVDKGSFLLKLVRAGHETVREGGVSVDKGGVSVDKGSFLMTVWSIT